MTNLQLCTILYDATKIGSAQYRSSIVVEGGLNIFPLLIHGLGHLSASCSRVIYDVVEILNPG